MIISTKEIKEACKKILAAVDSSESTQLTETLELKTEGKSLCMNVTNREYYTRVLIGLDNTVDFHATVNANRFLKLIPKITTDTINMEIVNNVLKLTGNGSYEFPLIFDGESLLNLPEIEIKNVTSEFDIDGSILLSILNYNSKELEKKVVASPVQRAYYIDDQGALTFTTGACVNNFHLDKPIKILLDARTVKLFSLFESAEKVHFVLGHDAFDADSNGFSSSDLIQTKVQFSTDSVVLTSILSCDSSLVAKVPCAAIRGRANSDYLYSIMLSKSEIIGAIDRLSFFVNATKPYGTFEFTKDKVTIFATSKGTHESISYKNSLDTDFKYSAMIDIMDVYSTVKNCTESYVTMNFGDHEAMVISRGNVYNVIPEVTEC